jgi:hypothetical protein
MIVLGCFLRKKGLSWRPVHVGARHVCAHLPLCIHSIRARQYSYVDHVGAHLSNDVEDRW